VVDNDGAPSSDAVDAKFKKWFPDLVDAKRQKLVQLHAGLIKFNKAINLVSPLTLRSAEGTHFADCILASRLIFPNLVAAEPLYDVGSGNGFPGLVFAILYPERSIVLVDRDTRKAEYLKQMSAELQLKNVTIDPRSCEVFPANSMTNVVARGFAPLGKAMLTLRKQVRVGGRFFHMKGDGFANELAKAPSQIFSLWTPSVLGQYRIPETSTDLAVVVTQKTAE
jgi:16S rRNA (guanine527-N7)-methyltransferase